MVHFTFLSDFGTTTRCGIKAQHDAFRDGEPGWFRGRSAETGALKYGAKLLLCFSQGAQIFSRALEIQDECLRCWPAIQHQNLYSEMFRPHTDKTYSLFACSVFVVDVLITILTTTSYTVGRSEENMFLKFIFSSSLGDAIKSQHDLFLFL